MDSVTGVFQDFRPKMQSNYVLTAASAYYNNIVLYYRLNCLHKSKYFIRENVLVAFEHSHMKVLIGENNHSLQKGVTFPGYCLNKVFYFFIVNTAFHPGESYSFSAFPPLLLLLTYVVRCAIWCYLYNLKNVKNNHGGVLILIKLLYC